MMDKILLPFFKIKVQNPGFQENVSGIGADFKRMWGISYSIEGYFKRSDERR